VEWNYEQLNFIVMKKSNCFILIDNLITEIADTSSRNAKLELLGKFKSDSEYKVYYELMKELFFITMDPYHHYYISEVNNKRLKDIDIDNSIIGSIIALSGNGVSKDYNEFEVLIVVFKSISDNEIRGHEGLSLMKSYLDIFPHMEDWVNCILQRDLEIGLQYDSIIKVFTDLEIPYHAIKKCATIDDGIKLNGIWLSDPKLDGLRLTFLPTNNTLIGWSSAGKPLYNLDKIIDGLINGMIKLGLNPLNYVYDGEAFVEDWSLSVSIAKTDRHKDADKLHFALFDVIPHNEWKSEKFKMILKDRVNIVNSLADDSHYIDTLKDHRKLINFDEIKTDHFTYINDVLIPYYLEHGYEGTVLKRLDSTYDFERNDSWLKGKMWFSDDYKITDVEEGSGRLKGTMGAVYIDINGVEGKVGGGFSDDQRDYVWKNRTTIIDKYIEVYSQMGVDKNDGSFKKSKFTVNGVLRFPVFGRFRFDK